jgi:hypothetical protein
MLTIRIIIVVLACLLTVVQTKADEIRAKNDTVQFDFEEKADAQGRTCNLMTMIVDPGRPETAPAVTGQYSATAWHGQTIRVWLDCQRV